MKRGEKIALITFGMFMAEAIIHYNLGKKEAIIEGKEGGSQWLPPPKSLLYLAVMVGLFSIVNGIVIKNVVD